MRKNDELSQDEKTELKRLTGQTMWISSQTRPDVAFDVCQMSKTGKFPKVKLLFETNKALQKWKSRTGSITFPQLAAGKTFRFEYCLLCRMQPMLA